MTDQQPNSYAFKLVTLGEGRVGKTSLILRYTQDAFDEAHPSTMVASFVEKRVNVDSNSVLLNLWDTAGQERFHALGPIYYRDADAALLVFDVTDVESFVKVKRWVSELRSMVDDDLPIALAGNKSDLERDRSVDVKEVEAYAESNNLKLLWTSALSGKNVETVFLHLARAAVARAKNLEKLKPFSNRPDPDKIILSDAPPPLKAKENECCM